MAAAEQMLPSAVIVIVCTTEFPQPQTSLSVGGAGGEGEAAGGPLDIELRLLLRFSKNQHIIDTISHLQSNPTDGLIFSTGLKSSIIRALLTSLFSLPDEHVLDLTPCSFSLLGFCSCPSSCLDCPSCLPSFTPCPSPPHP